MSNPNTFINSYSDNIVKYVDLMETLRSQNDQINQDPTLIDRYFDQPSTPSAPGFPSSGGPRTDITKDDVMAAHGAIVQLLFAFDSGSPPQKAALYKMLP
jgi:hypothetical protein